ncbi:DUF2000 family protein [Chelatococcus sp. GCM10030263]|uniref:DUF2000 family protein n=1 Tax=Chelatococcus sp. GCM10030263 TaxID=3273387 RepID=UPI00361BC73F
MRFDTKIAIVVRDDIPTWQKLNMTAFLASGIAGRLHETLGEPYRDGSGRGYCAMFRQPVLVFAAPGQEAMRAAYEAAFARELTMAIFTDDLFTTGHDDANRAAVATVAAADLSLAGLAIHGPKNAVDRALKGLPLHA